MLQSIDEICRRYDDVILHLHSPTESDDEERWQLKESTKSVVAQLEKQAVPITKQPTFVLRDLSVRLQTLIEKCERVFPRLDELAALKSLHAEIRQLVNTGKTPRFTHSCTLYPRFGGYNVIGRIAGENESVFLFVAQKLGMIPPGGCNETVSGPISPTVNDAEDDLTIHPKRPSSEEKIKETKSNDVRNPMQDESDTETIRTRTIHTDPLYDEDEEKRADLLWKSYDDDADVVEMLLPPRRRRHVRKRILRQALEKFGMERQLEYQFPEQESRDQVIERAENVPPPTTIPPEQKQVDWIGLAKVASARKDMAEAEMTPPSPTCSLQSWIFLLFVVMLPLNLIILGGRWVARWSTSPETWAGVTLWPAYCKVANRLCKDGYEFACTDYCASRLDRYLWGRK